jgi:hypothetical protein
MIFVLEKEEEFFGKERKTAEVVGIYIPRSPLPIVG